jgi:protein TonB
MDTNKIMNADYLDIVFDGRNKAYGSYELRRNYARRVGRSLMLMGGLCAALIGYATLSMSMKPTVVPIAYEKTITLITPPPIDPIKPEVLPPPPPPPPVKPMQQFTPPVIRNDAQVNETEVPPKLQDITAVGPRNQDGDSTGVDPIITAPGTGPIVVTPPPAAAIPTYVEQMPAPGYNMNEYLSKNLNYPTVARENNIEGRVLVTFVINEDGSVSHVKAIRPVGGGLDEEATRVVSAMPKWKPGKQNGIPTKVYFTLPINFTLAN